MWTPEYLLLSTAWVDSLADGPVSLDLPEGLKNRPLIVRSSIVGETIWDRGTFLSIPFDDPPDQSAVREAISKIRGHATAIRPGAKVAIILQRFLPNCIKGTLGNLNRLSRTREHWTRFTEVDGYNLAPDRFNSQRDAPAQHQTELIPSAQKPIDRVFASTCRWLIDHFSPVLRRDRMLLEWAEADGRLYLLQCDLDDDNLEGVDPNDLPIYSKLIVSDTPPAILSEANDDNIPIWDKLKILEELSIDYAPLPQKLYVLSYRDASKILTERSQRESLIAELQKFFEEMAVIRVSRRSGADKTTNLPCTSSCLDPISAAAWMHQQLEAHTSQGGELEDLAFILHKYIGARAGAWALYDPDSPYIQVHANWGLPDSLQFYPYDAWDVHTITEEVTAYPSYKSHFLWPNEKGEWTFKQIRNGIGRHQCLRANEVLEIARKTNIIGTKLGKRVAIMWFAGVELASGGVLCLPWYRTYEYSNPDLDSAIGQDHVVVPVRAPGDLENVKAIVPILPSGKKVAMDIQPSEHLVRDHKFLGEIISLAQTVGSSVIYSGSPLSHPYFQLQGKVPVYLRLHRKSFRTRGRIKYQKLVRDRIPERIRSKRERVVFANLKPDEILQLLIGKLIEESQELLAAEGQDATAEELADVYEVLRGIMHQAGVDEKKVLEIADAKREKVGGFDHGVFLLETSLPKPGEPTIENRDVNFGTLVGEEYAGDRVRVPFSLLGNLSKSGERLFRIPGSDKGVRLSAGRDGFELSLEQLEHQLDISFLDDDMGLDD
ncbi:nucleoside triphosphate pyrophosphohydrolase [Mesorhizobium sp. LNJC399B00]|nr:nucleoside triphosphate pyrophosphohydrolase [Mesorhizobium sp. LNJC399B00]